MITCKEYGIDSLIMYEESIGLMVLPPLAVKICFSLQVTQMSRDTHTVEWSMQSTVQANPTLD